MSDNDWKLYCGDKLIAAGTLEAGEELSCCCGGGECQVTITGWPDTEAGRMILETYPPVNFPRAKADRLGDRCVGELLAIPRQP